MTTNKGGRSLLYRIFFKDPESGKRAKKAAPASLCGNCGSNIGLDVKFCTTCGNKRS